MKTTMEAAINSAIEKSNKKVKIPKGYFSSKEFEGQMPDERWQTFDGEDKYHSEFWNEYDRTT